MLISNQVSAAQSAEEIGIDRFFVDLEKEGKMERQSGLHAHFADHTIEDVHQIRRVLKNTELLVRCNPISERSAVEISAIIAAGADIVMLPMVNRPNEAARFIHLLNGKAKSCLLIETPQCFGRLPSFFQGAARPDELFLGLNDLTLGLKLDFLFEPLAGGLVDHFCNLAKNAGLTYGFGGIGAIGTGEVLADLVLAEHVRLGSTAVILSRAFRDFAMPENCNPSVDQLKNEIIKIRQHEQNLRQYSPMQLADCHNELCSHVARKIEIELGESQF